MEFKLGETNYRSRDCQVSINTYYEGNVDVNNETFNTPEHKDVILKILNFLSPKGTSNVIHCDPMNYSIEGMKTRVPKNIIFFILQNNDTFNFFSYKFSGNKNLLEDVFPQSFIEFTEKTFFEKLNSSPNLTKINESFLKSYNSLKLHNDLTDSLTANELIKPTVKI